MADLSLVATEALAAELFRRGDLRRPDGFLTPDCYRLRAALGTISCVDGLAVRSDRGAVEVGVIRRNTGPFAGRLCLIGGGVAYRERVEDAIRRHFRTDLGQEIEFLDPLGWERPFRFRQYCPRDAAGMLPPDFGEEPTKHSFAVTYLVRLRTPDRPAFSSTTHGGQEASGLEWFHAGNLPSDAEFGYDMGPTVRTGLEEAVRFVVTNPSTK